MVPSISDPPTLSPASTRAPRPLSSCLNIFASDARDFDDGTEGGQACKPFQATPNRHEHRNPIRCQIFVPFIFTVLFTRNLTAYSPRACSRARTRAQALIKKSCYLIDQSFAQLRDSYRVLYKLVPRG
jgi:hypothetical protein